MQADKNTSIFLKSYDRSDWKNVRLGDIVEYSKGTGLSKEKLSDKGLYRCILYGELFTRYKEIINTVHSKTFCLEGTPSVAGDVLLPGSTTTCGEDLAKASSLNFEDILLGGDIIILRPKKNQVIGDFLSYLIPMYKKDMLKYTQGITIIHLQGKKLLDLTISIPPIDIQKNIVKNIQKIDLLISNLEKLISKQESIKKSTINLLLKPNKDWETVKIKDVFTVTRGLVLSTTEMSKHKTDKTPFPVYSSQTQNNGLIGFYSAFLYQDAITWTTDGANAGFVRFRPGKFYCTNVCGVLLSEKGHANACIATILGSVSKKYVSYVGNPKLMNNVMAEIPISIPPIDQQKQIAQKLSAIDEHISNLKLQLKKQQDLKQGLMQYFFGD